MLSMFASSSEAAWRFNPYTGKLDYYEVSAAGSGSGNVGVGTTNRVVIQIGTTTTGTPANVNVDSNGNFGIGTINPTALLEIDSNLAQDLFRIDDSAGTDATPFIIDQTGNVGIGTAVPLAVLSVASTTSQPLFRVDDNGDGDLSPFIIDADGNVGIGTANTQRDKLLVMGGNVGIGTWIPSTSLDVKGTIVSTGLRLSTNPNAGTVLVGDATGIGTWMVASTLPITSSQWVTQNTTDVSLAGGNVGVGTTFTTNAAWTIMNGNVGIGTWKPTKLLDVASGATHTLTADNNSTVVIGGTTSINGNGISPSSTAAVVQNTNATAGSNLTITGGASSTSSLTLKSTSASGTTDSISLITNNGTRALFAANSGNVGLGTTLPLARLAVVGGVGIGTVGGASLLVAPPTNGMIIDGNVGINSTAPGQKLDVQGTVRLSGTLLGSTSAGIGWSVKAGANTACTTTCSAGSACVFGEDSGTVGVLNSSVVDCADATADKCICAGP